jgi:hypothetical protein
LARLTPSAPVATRPAAPWPPQRPPRRPRRPSGRPRSGIPVARSAWVWAGLLAVSAAALALLATADPRPAPIRAFDDALAGLGVTPGSGPWQALQRLAELGAVAGYLALWIPTVVLLAWLARWRHLVVYVATISVVAAVAQLFFGHAGLARALRAGVTGSEAHLELPAWGVLVLASIATATLHVLVPRGRRRLAWAAVTGVVLIMALVRITLGIDSPSAALVSGVLGTSAAALAFVRFAPESEFPVTFSRQVGAHLRLDGRRRDQVLGAVRDQLGLPVTDLQPYRLDGSAGSTPCRLRLAQGPPDHVFGKLYATSHLRSDRWYKLLRVLLYGRLEDEAPFASVRRLVEHEDYMLRLLRDEGVRVPEPLGVVEVQPGREYLLVTELVPDAVEIGEADVDDDVVDDALILIRRLWRAGAAHRDIKPSNLLVRGREVYLVDVSFGELRPSSWRQAVDLANMLLILALAVGAPRVVERARLCFDDDELAEAFAATGSVTIPRQLRRLLGADGRDLIAEFRALLPERPPVAVQRWSVRRVLLAVATVVGVPGALALLALNLRAGNLL